jgi:hypothetical protein
LNKITSINSQLKLHKEKEMADFRKWLFAFAVVALMLGLQVTASAQVNAPAFACTANAGVPPIVRSEGVTELVGDLILNCTGGTPTPNLEPIPLSNVQIFLNTQVTSRILSGGLSEATMLIDEPYPGGQPPVPSAATAPPVAGAPTVQTACQAVNSVNCVDYGVYIPGVSPPPVGANGPYSGLVRTVGDVTYPSFNVFQGIQNSVNSVSWLGVPIDAPGTTGFRVIRITNVRANACNLGVSSTFIPTQIIMFISVNGSQQVTINNPQQLVAYAQQGLLTVIGTGTFVQCDNLNGDLLNGSTGQTGTLSIIAKEGFASSFKPRSFAQVEGQTPGPGGPDSPASLQNVPGFAYASESGYVAVPGGNGVGFGLSGGSVGLADTGTEISVTISNIGAGVSLFLPTTTISLIQSGTENTPVPTYGVAVLVGGASGGGAVNISGGTATITYEILGANPNVFEDLVIPITPAYITTGPTVPLSSLVTAVVNFAPAAGTNTTASATAPIPRFCTPYTAANFFTLNPCTCNLLFPFVTNQAGFDTGIAIANTTADTLNGLAPQSGTVTLTYYGGTTGGGAAPATQVTNAPVPAGSELVFTLFAGGNYGIAATPGFQGYIIARADFQYCHAFAFISDLGAQKLAEGYLAIQLDIPGLNRTGVPGENEGH